MQDDSGTGKFSLEDLAGASQQPKPEPFSTDELTKLADLLSGEMPSGENFPADNLDETGRFSRD